MIHAFAQNAGITLHIETLYEIDILFGDEAKKLGLNFKRAPSLNAEPLFIEALAKLVEGRVAAAGGVGASRNLGDAGTAV